MLLQGIKYSAYVALPFLIVLSIFQYLMVESDPYKTDSSGVAYFVYSTPIQLLILLAWGKYNSYNIKQLGKLTIIFCVIAFVAHITLWLVYFGAGGRF
ncbi:hypothetical protein [Neptunomonas phycophila]|uniref:hypothetical protein n=1 Tax=Neptunomonas phycophila TaxID=1572645 RepID=UPI0030F5BD68